MSEISKVIQALSSSRSGQGEREGSKELVALMSKLEEIKESLETRASSNDYDPMGPKKIDRLKEAFESLSESHVFTVGDIVKWKNGLKNRKLPKYNEPGIVIEYIPDGEIFLGEKDAGTPYFREPLNLLVGLIHEDGGFLIYHFDARRFEPWEAKR